MEEGRMKENRMEARKLFQRMHVVWTAAFMLVCLMTVAFLPVKVQAAGKVTKQAIHLLGNHTYTGYDIDGDGKSDKIKVKYTSYQQSNGPCVTVLLNTRYLTTIHQRAKGGDAYLMVPTQGQAYLAVQNFGFGFNTLDLYRYQNRRFVKAYQKSLGEEALDYAVPDKVWSNGFSVNVSMGKHQTYLGIGRQDANGNYLDPEATFRVNYKLVKGKAVLSSRGANAVGKYHAGKAQRQLRLSSTASHNSNNKGPLMKKGEKGILYKIYINTNKNGYTETSYQIKTASGKYGWYTPSMYSNVSDWYNSAKWPFKPLY